MICDQLNYATSGGKIFLPYLARPSSGFVAFLGMSHPSVKTRFYANQEADATRNKTALTPNIKTKSIQNLSEKRYCCNM